ncbi:peptidase inhibitor [Kitasatospora griseola]|uniref:peptidase inhibitor n=1 Tax=Kitasatospora griseola TaxID=2064 RepID=UPI003830D816
MNRRAPLPALTAGVIAAVLGFAPSASADAGHAASGATRAAALQSYRNGWNSGGEMCAWPTWQYLSVTGTADNCAFIRDGNAGFSVADTTGNRVRSYTNISYNQRVDSTTSGGCDNLQGSYQIRSLTPLYFPAQ